MRRVARIVLAVGLVVLTVVNAVEFRGIDAAARHNYRAWYRYDSGDALEVAIARDDSSRRWLAPFVYLGRLFPDATVVYPSDGVRMWFEFESAVLAFARPARLVAIAYDAERLVDLATLAPHRVPARAFAPSRGGTRAVIDARVAYYRAPQPSLTVVTVTPDGPPWREGVVAFVDAALLDPELVRSWALP